MYGRIVMPTLGKQTQIDNLQVFVQLLQHCLTHFNIFAHSKFKKIILKRMIKKLIHSDFAMVRVIFSRASFSFLFIHGYSQKRFVYLFRVISPIFS